MALFRFIVGTGNDLFGMEQFAPVYSANYVEFNIQNRNDAHLFRVIAIDWKWEVQEI